MRRLFVVCMLIGMAMGVLPGCGSKSDNASQSVFPTAENKIVDGTAITTITVAEGMQMQAISGQVIAEFYDTATHADYVNLETFLKGKGFQIIGQIPVLHMVQIGVMSDGQIVSLIADLKNLNYIEDAYPNMVISSTRDPNPAVFTGSSWLDDISARDAWNISTGKREVIIGIVDDGVDPNNAQFKKNNIRSLNSFNVGDGHGLGVASVAIANGDDTDVNGTGVNNMAGVCWNCSAVAYDSGIILENLDFFMIRGIAKINQGIVESINAGARVVNISQAPSKESTFWHESFRTMLKESIKFAHGKGVLLVIAAGNQPVIDDELFLPGFRSSEYEGYWKSNVIVVTGSYKILTSSADSIDYGDVTGKVVDIAAPSLGISTATKDGSVIDYNGTSYAAPMVIGTAGLIWSVNPNLPPSEVKAIITDPKNTNPAANSTIRVLNAYRALSDPRVSGIKVGGIGLATLTNTMTGGYAILPVKFSQTGSSITATELSTKTFPNGSYRTSEIGQLSGTTFDIPFNLFDLTGMSGTGEVKGVVQRSTYLTGGLSINGELIGKARADLLPIDENPPICTGMGTMGTIRLVGTNIVTQSLTLTQSAHNPSVLSTSSAQTGIYSGEGWISGNQIFLEFLDASDPSNLKPVILKGTLSDSCGFITGTWEAFPFDSDIPVGHGTWSLMK